MNMLHEGEELRKIIKYNKLGETAISEKLGVSRQTIYNHYKSENLSNKVKQNYLDKCGIDINEIYTRDQSNLTNYKLEIKKLNDIVKLQAEQLKAAYEVNKTLERIINEAINK